MPEFILDHGTPETGRAFRALDAFTRGYIEAAFFTEMEFGTTRETWDPERHSSLPGDATLAQLAPETLAEMVGDCQRFQTTKAWQEWSIDTGANADEEKGGRDFWYTRNGHGVGFWEPGRWPDPYGSHLDAAAKAFGEVNLYLGDDGLIYGG